jgi:hypothetical protein
MTTTTSLSDSAIVRLRKQVGAADQLVLFGSRAADVARPNSDWDVLLVRADGPAIRCASKIDLVEIQKAQFTSSAWLGSELAGHIAAYGRWIVGDPTWAASVHCSKRAIERKGDRLKSRLQNMLRSWGILQPAYRKNFATVVRRDVQRYRCLVEGRPVAPSSILDDAWGTAELEAAFPLVCARLSTRAAEFLEELLLLS